MCKKIILSALALAAACGLSAKHLTPQEALSRAGSAGSGPAKAQALSSMSLKRMMLSPENQAALYLFAGDGKALILPADDRVAAVLGYIDTNAEGEIPPVMEWWLEQYVRQIDYVMSLPEQGTGLYVTPVMAQSSSAKAPIAPMLHTTWDQGTPYNNLCPKSGSTRTYTGCVATAAAQVMNFFQYPEKGTGTITYKDNYTTRTLNLDNKSFDWSNMLDSYSGEYTTTQADAVAYLMQAVGYASQMSYSTSASGAHSNIMIEGVKKYFNYNQKAQILYRDNFPLAQWEDIIYEQLQKVGPVYYAGDDQVQGGHAFVCDGYSSDGYFHFNWGWSGMYDGYFKLTALVPEGQGTGGNAGGFNFGQEIIVNFTTPTGTTVDLPAVSPLSLIGNLTAEADGNDLLYISSDQAESQNVAIYNSSGATVTVSLALKAVNTATGSTAIGEDSGSMTWQTFQGTSGGLLNMPANLPTGLYKVYVVARTSGSQDWLDINAGISCANYVNVQISNGNIVNVSNVTGGELSVSGLQVESDVYMGYKVKFSYTVANNSDFEIYDGIQPMIITISGGSATPKSAGDPAAVDLLPGESLAMSPTPEMYVYTGASSFTGSAYFALVSTSTNAILAYVPVTVKAKPATLSPTATTFTMEGNALQADANNLRFNCGVKINAGYWADPMTVYISNSAGSVLQTLTSTDTYFLSSGQQASTTVAGSFPSAVANTYYYATFGYLSGYYVTSIPGSSQIRFKVTTPFSGVESVATDNTADAVTVSINRQSAMLVVTAPSAIAAVEVYTLDGRMVLTDVDIDGNSASASLAALPAGILLVKTTLTDGSTSAVKVAR